MNEFAPEGKVFVCYACGKMSNDKYGERSINPGWDVSCVMNCGLEDRRRLVIKKGRVVKINRKPPDPSPPEAA